MILWRRIYSNSCNQGLSLVLYGGKRWFSCGHSVFVGTLHYALQLTLWKGSGGKIIKCYIHVIASIIMFQCYP